LPGFRQPAPGWSLPPRPRWCPAPPGCCAIPRPRGACNAAALKIMEREKIRVNDLYAYCLSHLDTWQQPKNVHFRDVGSVALAERVAEVVGEALAARAE